MDLALLVYGISVIQNLGAFLTFITFIALLVAIGSGIGYFAGYCESEIKTATRFFKYSAITLAIVTPILVLTPSEKTMYTMVGAYAAQKISEDPRVEQLSGKVLKIVENKLDEYIEQPKK